MKHFKAAAVIAAGAIAAAAFPFTVSSEELVEMDYNGDGAVDAFDMVNARKTASAKELKELSDFLLGVKSDSENELIWSDEFDGDTLDTDKWNYDIGNWKRDESGNFVAYGWGNNEQEFYTNRNATVHDGVLTIAARKETVETEEGTFDYTSARLNTQHKFSACGGRIEVRARCDSGRTLWPAIWMLPEDSVYGGWAASGEIDIMEGWGSLPEKVCGTVHFGDVWPNNAYLTNDYNFPTGESSEDWHTYAVEWESGEIRWYVDDILYSTQREWNTVNRRFPAPFDQNFYIILNLAVGGHFDGIDRIYADPETFASGEKHFDIDYVRVYDRGSFTPTLQTSRPLGLYTEGSDAGLSNMDGCSVFDIKNVGELEYAVMGLIRAQEVKAGNTYNLSFDVTSTAERDMTVTVEDSSYERYLSETIHIGKEPLRCGYAVEFDKDMTVDLKFQLGNIGESASAGAHQVKISNIEWR